MLIGILATVFLCLLAAGFFAGAETAITSANRAALHQRSLRGDAKAARAQIFLARMELILGTTLVGTNGMQVAATTLAGIVIHHYFASDFEPLVNTLVMTPLILVIGELVPKSLARAHCDTLVPLIVKPLRAVQLAIYPLVAGTAWLAIGLGRLFGLQGTGEHGRMTREDVYAITQVAAEEGVVPEGAVLMMQTVLGLGMKPVSAVMKPLVDVVALPENGNVGDIENAVCTYGYARYPVFAERIDNLVGLVDAREVVFGAPADAKRGGKPLREAPIADYVRHDLNFVPESKPVGDLLHELQFSRSPLAAVVDEHGGVTGIVTTEDLIEEVVGEIMDERDEEAPTLVRLDKGAWECDGRFEIQALGEELGYAFRKGQFTTLAGLIMLMAGKIPAVGDRVHAGPFQLEVLSMEKRRIARVRINRKN